jgi:hypothetical protein
MNASVKASTLDPLLHPDDAAKILTRIPRMTR